MSPRIWIAGAAVGAALASGVGLASAGSRATTLEAYVGDPAKIVLTQGGKPVTALHPGSYVVVVRDAASDHDFHLHGPGVDKRTSVRGTGTVTWRVRLKSGKYTFVCDPHALFMKGSFTVL
jgi:plastocyanin